MRKSEKRGQASFRLEILANFIWESENGPRSERENMPVPFSHTPFPTYTVSGKTAPTWNTDGGLHTFAGNTYVYDALQRLTEVDYSGGKTLFSYDPLGRRVKKVDANASGQPLSTFSYHYDGSEVAVEYQPSTTWTYYLGLGLDQVVLRDSGSAKQWYYRDGHGSTSAVTDNSGNILEQYEYNAQGQFQITNGSGTVENGTQISNDIMFTGREYDSETGNYFYRARYYNPTLGRFISRDPLSGAEFSQGTNLYAYCQNNYLNSLDPTGKSWASTAGYFAAGVAVGVVTAAVIVAAAPVIASVATAGLVAVGVSEVAAAATVTAGAAVAAGVGTAAAVVNTADAVSNAQQTGNWDQVAFDAGSIVGAGAFTGGTMAASDWSLSKDLSMGYDPSLGSVTDWLATMPTDTSAALAASATGAGLDTTAGRGVCGK